LHLALRGPDCRERPPPVDRHARPE